MNTTLAHEAGHGLMHTHLLPLQEEKALSSRMDQMWNQQKVLCRDEKTTNGDGDRVKQEKDSVVTEYVQDSNPKNERVLLETMGSTTTYYVYGHDLRYTIEGTTPHFLHADSLGSTVAVTDANGDVEQTFAYDIFGQLRKATGSGGLTHTFTGEENDHDGLVYLRARYYEPAVGRFVSRDPFPADAKDTQTFNRYVYVKNNPTNYVDPSGEFWGGLKQAAANAAVRVGARAITVALSHKAVAKALMSTALNLTVA